jgi:hypothetical protein
MLSAEVWDLPVHGTVNSAYTASIPVNNPSHLKLTFSLKGGKLPKGVQLTQQGQLHGKPQESGTFPITIQVAVKGGGTLAPQDYKLYIDEPTVQLAKPPAQPAVTLANPSDPPKAPQPPTAQAGGSPGTSGAAGTPAGPQIRGNLIPGQSQIWVDLPAAPAVANAGGASAANAGGANAANAGGANAANAGGANAANAGGANAANAGGANAANAGGANAANAGGANAANAGGANAANAGGANAANAGGANAANAGGANAANAGGANVANAAKASTAATAKVSVLIGGKPVNLKDSTGAISGSMDASGSQASLNLETPLATGDSVQVKLTPASGSALTSDTVVVADPLDLGRIRYYFTAGIVVSNSQGFQVQSSGSQAGVFLGLNADRSWLISNQPFWRRIGLNTFFDARLTSVATQGATATTTPAASTGSGSTPTTTTTPASTALNSFLQSQKAGSLQAGTYIPIMTGEWARGSDTYAFFVAPLAKAGFTTLTSQQSSASTTSGTATTTTPAATSLPLTGQFYTSYSYGGRFGVFRTYKDGNGDWDTNSAPELVSYVDVTTGRFGNFEGFRDLTVENTGASSTTGADYFLRLRPWRYSFEGLLKIPHSPFVVGFNANIGRGAIAPAIVNGVTRPYTQPRDDLRFLFGAQFDFTKLLKAIPTL